MLTTYYKTGIQADGIITAGIGALLIIVAVVNKGKPGKSYSILGSLVAFVALVIVIIDMGGINDLANTNANITVRLGSGIYLSLLAAVLSAIGGFIKVI